MELEAAMLEYCWLGEKYRMWAPAEISDQLRLLTRFRFSADVSCPLPPLAAGDITPLSWSGTDGVSFIGTELDGHTILPAVVDMDNTFFSPEHKQLLSSC